MKKAKSASAPKKAITAKLGPVVMDPKKIAKEAVHGKPGAKVVAAPVVKKSKKDEPKFNSNAVDILRDVQKGATFYGHAGKDGKPFWLKVGTPGKPEESRVAYSKIEPLVTVTKKDAEDEGLLYFGLTAQGKSVVAAATK